MSNALKGRTNMPRAERGQGIPEVELSDCWKDYPFVSKGSRALTTNTEKPKDGVLTDVAAETDVYDIKDAHQIFTADDNSDVIMPDGQVVPSLAKVIKSITDSK